MQSFLAAESGFRYRGKKYYPRRGALLSIAVLVCFSAAAPLFAQNIAAPSAEVIIQKSVRTNQVDWAQAPQYDFFERDRQGDHTKTYHVLMLAGSPYNRLVAVDGKALSPAEDADEQRKLENAKSERERETAEQRDKRIADYQKERSRDHLLMEQLPKAFHFRLRGEQRMGSYNVYVLQATPRKEYQPPNREAKVLTGMRGTLWIDRKSYQWVKVEAQVVHPVSIEGFLARVEPGTRFELEEMPVGPGVWLPKHFSMKAKAKILGLVGHSENEDETYFNYRKTSDKSQPGPGD